MSWPIALTRAVDWKISSPSFGLQRGNPAPLALIPARRFQFGVEPEMLADAVLGRDLLQIVEKFLPLAKIARPGISPTEGVGIGMVRRIDAAAGIAVDVPGPAKLVVLFDDGVGNAQAAERDAKRNRADPGADDQDVLLRQSLVRRSVGPAGVARDKSHFLAHQRRIFHGDVLAEAGAHHLQDQFIAGVIDDRLRVAVREQFDDGSANLILNSCGQAGVGVGDEADVARRPVRRLQPALIARHMHQHHQ